MLFWALPSKSNQSILKFILSLVFVIKPIHCKCYFKPYFPNQTSLFQMLFSTLLAKSNQSILKPILSLVFANTILNLAF